MSDPIALQPIDELSITLLVDNSTDPFLVDTDAVARCSWPLAFNGAVPRAPAAVTPELGRPDMPIAEPGFSALVRIRHGGTWRTLLFDTGVSPDGAVENMRRLGVVPDSIELVVLSHGHWDHVTGMEGLMRVLGRAALPAFVHPEFFARRRIVLPGRAAAELPVPSRAALDGLGVAITEDRRPSFLLDCAVLITGEVDRSTAFESGFPGHEAWHGDGWAPDPLILDDQALVVRLRDRGLVVLSGCGHAGIVNTVRHARRLTGEDRVAAIIGGFHLSGPAFEPRIEATVEAIAALAPELLVPAHCTGWRALARIAQRLPDAYVPSAVGTTITL